MLGKTSLERLANIDERLIRVIQLALTLSPVDGTIPWMGGKRSDGEQNKIFTDNPGATKADGYVKKSYHQSGLAFDIQPYIKKPINTTKHHITLAKYIFKAFDLLKSKGVFNSSEYLHWGGFWKAKDLNNDGYITDIDDTIGWDKRHFELRSYPQKNVLKFK